MSIFETNLEPNPANYVPLSPVSFLKRAASICPDKTAVIHGARRYSYLEFWQRRRYLPAEYKPVTALPSWAPTRRRC